MADGGQGARRPADLMDPSGRNVQESLMYGANFSPVKQDTHQRAPRESPSPELQRSYTRDLGHDGP